ncbi:hypothetical protein FOCC_FOCC015604 [Frankliniella occidentalis]|nr:hypothetical protein FOCC_FOCC015604 [Frankliniella occidentalis]
MALSKSLFHHGYKETLQYADKDRYIQLTGTLTGGIDPFELDWKKLSDSIELLPAVNIVDITNYLVFTTKAHTMVQMRAYKATEAYKFLNDGWVQGVRCHVVDTDKVLVLGKVKHSYNVNDTPAKAWVLMLKDGTILAGWCSCIAGRGEACSHIGAVCYAVELGATKRDALTCTSKACEWLPPAMRDVPLLPISEYDLTPPDSKRKRLLDRASAGTPQTPEDNPDDPVPAAEQPRALTEKQKKLILTSQEVENFLGNLKLTDPNCVLLRVSENHSQAPEKPSDGLPDSLLHLYDEKYALMTYEELLPECRKVFETLCLSTEETAQILQASQGQGASKSWKKLRIGKFNASEIHSWLRTSVEEPAITYIKNSCYPSAEDRRTQYMRDGNDWEADARDLYKEEMKMSHSNFRVKTSGYFNIPEYVYLGASPDGLCNCDCCGKGLVEIKTRQTSNSNDIQVKHMYQMQQQMLLVKTYCKLTEIYCDYVIYRPGQKLFIERVYPDEEIWREIIEEGRERYIKIMLPELMGRYFTSLKNLLESTRVSPTVCFCMRPARQPMVKCNDINCTFTIFHFDCVGITNNRRKNWNDWYCPECSGRRTGKF